MIKNFFIIRKYRKIFFLLAVFLFFGVQQVNAKTATSTIKIYTDETDGYVTNWIPDHGTSQALWNLTHDAPESNIKNENRDFIEVASGWCDDRRLYIHRARLIFDLSQVPDTSNIKKIELFVNGRKKRNSLDDYYSYVSVVGANSFENLIEQDYSSIGESNLMGWGYSYLNDIVEISDKKNISDFKVGEYNSFLISDEFDKYAINKKLSLGLREGHDIHDIYPSDFPVDGAERIHFYSTEHGTTTAPYLEITYTYDDGEPENDTSPLLIIPGIMGSWREGGELVLDPILGTYDELVETFDSTEEYEKGVNFFSFPYEWRNSNVLTASYLESKITGIKESTGADKVDVIAHSMGGLVMREYLSAPGNEVNIGKLVFLATPHRGAPEAYLTWEGGEFSGGVGSWAIKKIFKQEARENGYKNIYNYVRGNSIYSIQELLPIYDYLIYKDNLRAYPVEYPRNEFLENLNQEDVLDSLADSGVTIRNYLGSGEKMIDYINVKPANNKKDEWEYGKPYKFNPFIKGEGDGTVPERSNQNFLDLDDVTFESSHRGIVSDSSMDVFQFLTGETLPEEEQMAMYNPIESMVFVMVMSPVDLQVINEEGELAGKDFETGESKKEIHRSFYTGSDAKSEFVSIVNPVEGDYQINLEGVGKGPYTVLVSMYRDGEEFEEYHRGAVKEGEIINLNFDINDEGLSKIKKEKESCDLFSVLKQKINLAKEEGFFKRESYYNLLINKVAAIEKGYTSESHSKTKNRIVKFRLKVLKAQLSFYKVAEWLDADVVDDIKSEIDNIINLID